MTNRHTSKLKPGLFPEHKSLKSPLNRALDTHSIKYYTNQNKLFPNLSLQLCSFI